MILVDPVHAGLRDVLIYHNVFGCNVVAAARAVGEKVLSLVGVIVLSVVIIGYCALEAGIILVV